jgi:hypothetical protein
MQKTLRIPVQDAATAQEVSQFVKMQIKKSKRSNPSMNLNTETDHDTLIISGDEDEVMNLFKALFGDVEVPN